MCNGGGCDCEVNEQVGEAAPQEPQPLTGEEPTGGEPGQEQ